MITVGDTFAGLGAMKLAFARAGAITLWASEINRQSISVYQRHHPEVEQLGDINHVGKHNATPVDVICGGSPCQNFSISGDRQGLAGKESQLFKEFVRVVKELRPAFAIWENVPGALSVNSGHDFGAILRAFHEIGCHQLAWRMLDAQYCGVPQRRRRVFIVADFRGQRASEILFEQSSAYRYCPEGKEAGTQIAYALTTKTRYDGANNETFIAAYDARHNKTSRVASTLQASGSKGSLNAMPLVAGTLAGSGAGGSRAAGQANELDFIVPEGGRLRRMTPVEWERLQGYSDNYTRYLHDGKEISDTGRYKMLGNSIAVPVMEWIARRMVEAMS